MPSLLNQAKLEKLSSIAGSAVQTPEMFTPPCSEPPVLYGHTYDGRVICFKPSSKMKAVLESLVICSPGACANSDPLHFVQELLASREGRSIVAGMQGYYEPTNLSEHSLDLTNSRGQTIRITYRGCQTQLCDCLLQIGETSILEGRAPIGTSSVKLEFDSNKLQTYKVDLLPPFQRLTNWVECKEQMGIFHLLGWKVKHVRPYNFGKLRDGQIVSLYPENLEKLKSPNNRVVPKPKVLIDQVTSPYWASQIRQAVAERVHAMGNEEMALDLYMQELGQKRYPAQRWQAATRAAEIYEARAARLPGKGDSECARRAQELRREAEVSKLLAFSTRPYMPLATRGCWHGDA